MTNKAISPEDLISDTDNYVIVKNVRVRKGTVGAAFANANILSSPDATEAEKSSAMQKLIELSPALVAIEMSKHVTWKNPIIQALIDKAESELSV